jgi:hypothetical protein
MKLLRYLPFSMLLATAVATVFVTAVLPLLGALAVGLLIRRLVWRGWRRSFPGLVPVGVFALVLAGLQWIARMPVTLLALKAVVVFLFSTSAFRLFPWADLTSALGSRGRLRTPVLFVLFTRHFAEILLVEATRVFRARSLCVRRPFGRGSFSSLVWVLISLFGRSISRAERFYAAQLLRGLGP